MNRRVTLLIVLSGLVLSSYCWGSDGGYPVSEVLRVRSLSAFDCKIDGYASAPSVRFRATVRGVAPAADIPEAEAVEYVRERFSQAESIVLVNVRFRNYFRVTADVTVDGTDLGEELRRMGLAQALETPLANGDATPPPVRRYRSPVEGAVEPSSARPQAPSKVKVKVITLGQLLETPADLSALNESTPLGEALAVISNAVRPRVPFVVLWNDLRTNALVDQQTPIGVGGFGKGVKLNQALKIILHSVSRHAPTKLTLAYEGRVVTLGTRKGLLQKARVESYSIEDIVSVPAYDYTDSRGSR